MYNLNTGQDVTVKICEPNLSSRSSIPAPNLKSQSSAMILIILLFFLWVGVCFLLRRRRLHLISSMDPLRHALVLAKLAIHVEFPLLATKALQFALFKTFAIPSISNLLVATRQFSPAAVTKRYEDTGILLQEIILNHVDGPRGSLALRRLNFIHGRYNISNQDFLYKLSAFILEPSRFASKFGYREWTENEKMATFVMWRDIGTRMGIRDIPDTVEGVEIFNRQYEAEKMVYSHSNKEIADATLDLLLSTVPACLRPSGRRIIYCLMEGRLLDAMGYPPQPYWLIWMVEVALQLCVGSFVKWFLPPRPQRWSTERIWLKEGEGAKVVHKLRYKEYEAESYPNGYRIDELGTGKPGEVGVAFGGHLTCPFLPPFSNPKKQRIG